MEPSAQVGQKERRSIGSCGIATRERIRQKAFRERERCVADKANASRSKIIDYKIFIYN